MNNGRKNVSFAWVALMLTGAALAADPMSATVKPGAQGTPEIGASYLPVTLERKQRLVQLLLAQSPAVKRIPQSNSSQAKKKLAEAQSLYAKAEGESSAGRTEAAIKLLDESLRQIASASSLVPDSVEQAARERSRNVELREAINTFQTLHKSLLSRMSTNKLQVPAVAANIDRIDSMVDKADALVAEGNQHEANVVLNTTYKMVVSTLNKILAAETIVYGLKFDSPADEFRHELARNRSYEELIPIALAQLNTARETATLAERSAQQSRDLRAAAQKQASGGDDRAAVKTIQVATSHLQRSLRIAGVVLPQYQEVPP